MDLLYFDCRYWAGRQRNKKVFYCTKGGCASDYIFCVMKEWAAYRGGRYDQNLISRYEKFYITITIYITV